MRGDDQNDRSGYNEGKKIKMRGAEYNEGGGPKRLRALGRPTAQPP